MLPRPLYIKHDKPMTYHEAELFQWLNVKGWAVAITVNTLIPTQAELHQKMYALKLTINNLASFLLVGSALFLLYEEVSSQFVEFI